VALYVPNIIAYIRLALVAAAIAAFYIGSASSCMWLVTASLALDAVDGAAARRWHQVGSVQQSSYVAMRRFLS
jgi:phosphatidylglycerophosphate synthase